MSTSVTKECDDDVLFLATKPKRRGATLTQQDLACRLRPIGTKYSTLFSYSERNVLARRSEFTVNCRGLAPGSIDVDWNIYTRRGH
jgi:hypothetical protein